MGEERTKKNYDYTAGQTSLVMGDEKSTLSVAERFLKRVGWPMVVIFYCPHLRTNTTSEEIEVQLGSTWSNFFIVFVYGHSPDPTLRVACQRSGALSDRRVEKTSREACGVVLTTQEGKAV